MFLEHITSEVDVQDAICSDFIVYSTNEEGYFCPLTLHGSCSFRNVRQNYVPFRFGSSALIRNSCIVRISNCFHCVLFTLKPEEVEKGKKTQQTKDNKQNLNQNKQLTTTKKTKPTEKQKQPTLKIKS